MHRDVEDGVRDWMYTVISLACLALAVAVPAFTFLWLRGSRGEGRRSRWRAIGATALALATGFTISPILFVVAVCYGPPPGESDRARFTKALAAPTIRGLEAYHRSRGSYPPRLGDLLPEFVSADSFPTLATGAYMLEYRYDSLDYELRFDYDGPGVNHCTYRRANGRWSCGGYF